jgi:uncharacterized membrane protein (UPF0127 family)
MNNATRRELLNKAKSVGYTGNILDVFSAHEQGRDLIAEFVQSQQPQVAVTPEEREQGLRPAHAQGNTDQSMVFPNIQPGQSFNTVGMKVPINIDKVDNQGNLVESYKAVPPGITNLPTGPYEGTVIESPARRQTGGLKYTTDPIKIQNYNDSLTVYNAFKNDKSILNNFNTFEEADNFVFNRMKKHPEILQSLDRLRNRPEGYTSISSSYTKDFPVEGGGRAMVVEEFPKPKQPYKKYDSKDMLVKATKLEIEPTQLIIPQSDRTLKSYNNTRQVLRSIQKEDKSNKNIYPTRIIPALEFQTGGPNIGGVPMPTLPQEESQKKEPILTAEDTSNVVHTPSSLGNHLFPFMQKGESGELYYDSSSEINTPQNIEPMKKQYFKGGLSNRVRYNKAKYKR